MLQWRYLKQKPFIQIYQYSHIFSHFQAYSHFFRHNQTYSGIIQAYSGIFRTLCNPGVFWILPTMFRTRGIFRTVVYSEPRNIQNPVKHLRWSVLRKQLTAIMIFAKSGFHFLYFVKNMYFLIHVLFLLHKYTLSKCSGNHAVLHRKLKLDWKISAGKYKKGKFTGVSWFSAGELSKNYV